MRMNAKTFLSVFIASVFLCIGKGMASNILEGASIVTENATYKVLLTDVKEEATCCPGEAELVFSVTDKKTDSSMMLSIHGRIAAIQDIIIVEKTKLTIVGKLKYGGYTFLIADLAQNALQEIIWAYDYAFSPSKRFLAYKTHYPKMIPPDARRSILIIYDLAKSVFDNRVALTKNAGQEVYGFIPDHSASGFPIFPETNVIKQSYMVTLEEEHHYLSPLLWSEDEKHLVFVEFYKEQNYLIHIDLSEGIMNPIILRQRIDLISLIRKEAVSEKQKEELKQSPYKLVVKEIHWKDKDRVVIHPYYREDWLDETIELSVPQRPYG